MGAFSFRSHGGWIMLMVIAWITISVFAGAAIGLLVEVAKMLRSAEESYSTVSNILAEIEEENERAQTLVR